MRAKLGVNIDHVATLRQARYPGASESPNAEPDLLAAASACERAGADGITVHLRGDRRHIQDRDIELLRDVVTTYLNVEMAATDEMLAIALICPAASTMAATLIWTSIGSPFLRLPTASKDGSGRPRRNTSVLRTDS